MPDTTTLMRQKLKTCSIQALFIEELGWNHHRAAPLVVEYDGVDYVLNAVAEKHGMVAYECQSGPRGQIPNYSTRGRIERKVAKSAHEHVIVFVNQDRTMQTWQWVRREKGKPTARREHTYVCTQPGDSLIQKLQNLMVSLEEEEKLTIVDVAGRVRHAFDVDRVTKRFYDRFKDEHKAFLSFVEGISAVANREWYASLMLNRLMFIYFIQKRGFLDGDTEYLRNRLQMVRQSQGKGKFHTFYRYFLRRLFHEGLGQRKEDRKAELNTLLGSVPYLNGGLFDTHPLENDNPEIHIPDEAFERLFTFFDAYQWHLDERPTRRDDEINPDVLGYIFEKYINQKQMGAYYTKEDITEYISKSTVVPCVLDAAEKQCPIAFVPNGAVWRLLRDDPDRYIYDAVKKGVALLLPEGIAAGVADVSKRGGWNRPADEDYALPTETWREHVARRTRCKELRARLAAGEIHSSNDLVTSNLDLRQFAQDVIETCEGPELLRAIYQSVAGISVLDPTCGSGAFLFAALSILEPLYEACLDRMGVFVEELDRSGEEHHLEILSDFRKVLDQANDRTKHPSRRYFILKSIVLSNLYGVDIMAEAVEICKLRLFLKLVAQVERVEDVEPLPDIDFNVRTGNTLVGYTSLEQIRAITKVWGNQGIMDLGGEMERIEQSAQAVDRAFQSFRALQIRVDGQSKEISSAKEGLREDLGELQQELNHYIAREYGVDAHAVAYSRWLGTHLPFHWFIEFYGIMRDGGFDVVVGNPPYVSAARVRKQYIVKNLLSLQCPDAYAWILERNQALLRNRGRTGMIVPLSLGFSTDFEPIRGVLFKGYSHNWFSSFGRIPSALFSFDVRVRNTIHIGVKDGASSVNHTTRLHRWFESARSHLFTTLEYSPFSPTLWKRRVPKLNTSNLALAFEKCLQETRTNFEAATHPHRTNHSLYFKKTAYNWLAFCRELPPCYENDKPVEHTKFGQIHFPEAETCKLAMLLGNGRLMLIYWCIVGDDFDVTRWNFGEFPVDFRKFQNSICEELLSILPALEQAMDEAVQFKLNAGRRVGNYNLAKCRNITDRSDRIFAQEVGLSDVWEDIELYYSQVIKTDFSNDVEDIE